MNTQIRKCYCPTRSGKKNKPLLKGNTNTLTFNLEDLLDDWFGVLREAREGVYYIQGFIIPVRARKSNQESSQ